MRPPICLANIVFQYTVEWFVNRIDDRRKCYKILPVPDGYTQRRADRRNARACSHQTKPNDRDSSTVLVALPGCSRLETVIQLCCTFRFHVVRCLHRMGNEIPHALYSIIVLGAVRVKAESYQRPSPVTICVKLCVPFVRPNYSRYEKNSKCTPTLFSIALTKCVK